MIHVNYLTLSLSPLFFFLVQKTFNQLQMLIPCIFVIDDNWNIWIAAYSLFFYIEYNNYSAGEIVL